MMQKAALPEPILKCLEYGIGVRMISGLTEDTLGFEIDGFYKSGTARLYVTGSQDGTAPFVVKSRFDRVEEIWDFEDLIWENKFWQDLSENRGLDEWKKLAPGWQEAWNDYMYKNRPSEDPTPIPSP